MSLERMLLLALQCLSVIMGFGLLLVFAVMMVLASGTSKKIIATTLHVDARSRSAASVQ